MHLLPEKDLPTNPLSMRYVQELHAMRGVRGRNLSQTSFVKNQNRFSIFKQGAVHWH